MLFSDFRVGLRKVNPHLRIYCGSSPDTFAGIEDMSDGKRIVWDSYTNRHVTETCAAISKNWVPRDRSVVGENLRLKYRSARDCLNMLFNKNKVTVERCKKVFGIDPRYTQPSRYL